jgi:putative membrane protein
MRLAALAGLVAGLVLTVLLVLHFGAPAVGAALRAAGFVGLVAIAALHLVAIAVMGLGWGLLPGEERRGGVSLWTFLWGRLMRDSGSEVLPLSQVGGYVLGARALILHGASGALAAASTVVDLTLELCGQIVYTALGLCLLLWLRPGASIAVPIVIGLAFAVVAVFGFVAVQRRGANLFDRMTARMARQWLTSIVVGAEAVQAEIHAIYARPRGLWACFLLHLLAWVISGTEAWIALRFMGIALGFAQVVVIESVLYAIRSAAFIVPNAIGVQEGAYVMLGSTFGLTPDIALGLSLLKRGRDLLLGIPALLAWQIFEGRRFWRGRPAPRRGEASEPSEPSAGGVR